MDWHRKFQMDGGTPSELADWRWSHLLSWMVRLQDMWLEPKDRSNLNPENFARMTDYGALKRQAENLQYLPVHGEDNPETKAWFESVMAA